MTISEIGIRILSDDDLPALRRLAERDSALVPSGEVLGATVNGTLAAARSLTSGAEVADPFLPTDQLRKLLADRARQLNGRRVRIPFRNRAGGHRARASLPASPPGAGGRLLEI